MNELPEFWRTEIWHPLSVHLPLGILLLGTVFFAISPFIKKVLMENMGNILIVIGTLGAWTAIYTGNLADSVVSREICDPTVLKAHETNAYIASWLFSLASIIILIKSFGFLKKIKNILKISIIAVSIIASGFLFYTGHLGATLVYQQAAGVYTPSEDCNEFTE